MSSSAAPALVAAFACVVFAEPREIVRLKTPVADVNGPVDIYSPATNGGSLVTLPDGAVRFFYRLPKFGEQAVGHEGSGSMLYEDRSDDGGQTWKLALPVIETGVGSGNDVAHANPTTARSTCPTREAPGLT